MLEAASELHMYLDICRAHGPFWSPDSTKIAFVADINGLDQAWVVNLIDGKLEKLTSFDNRVGLVAWSPIDQYIILTVDIEGKEHDQLYIIQTDNREMRPLTQNYDVIHRFGAWSPDGQHICYSDNSRKRKFFDIQVMNLATGTIRCVLAQDATLMPLAWSPDGRSLIVSRRNTSLDNDLLLVPLDGSSPRLLTAHNGDTTYTAPCFAPDGLTLYVVTNYKREFLAPAAISLTAKISSDTHAPLYYLVDTAWDVESELALSPDGKILSWTLNKEGCSQLSFYSIVMDKELPAPSLPMGVVEGLTWAPDGSQIAFSFNGARYNGNIWLTRLDDRNVHQLTTLPTSTLKVATLIEPSLIRYKSFDGLEIPAYYYQPNVNSRINSDGMPVIIFVHGGPASQFRPICSSPTVPPIQYFLNLGFAVFAPNVRGSRGYGKKFMSLDDGRLRPNSVADLKAAVEWLVVHGRADPHRIGIMGRSYGGFMVLAAITTYPDLWAAAIDIVGIANFLTFFQNTGIWRQRLRIPEYGDPHRDAEFLRELSPLFKADRIITPLLVVHGVNDVRVPVNEAEQIVTAVQARGLPSKLLLLSDEGHFMLHRDNQLIVYSSIADWFETYMK